MLIASMIMAIIATVLGVADSAVGGTARQKMLRKAEKLANQVNKVESLKNDLLTAYNSKDYELANNILMASPFSGSYQTLKKERARVTDEFNSKRQQLDELTKKINDSRAQASAGSTASGIVDGSLAHSQANSIKDDYSNEINKLVSGGVTNISSNQSSLGALPDPIKKNNT